MTTDRILAALAFLAVAAFLGILGTWVPLPDLVICMVIVLALIAYDFYTQLRPKKRTTDPEHRV